MFSHAPEKEAWEKLPCFIKNSCNRADFDTQLLVRASQFKDSIQQKLALSNQTEVLTTGDWHNGQCSFVASNGDKTLVVKPRDTEIDRYLGSLINKISNDLNFPLHVPEITVKYGLSHQEYIASECFKGDINRALAGLAAICVVYGIYDLHFENVIESKRHLNLIDLDCAFFSFQGIRLATLIDRSGIFYLKNSLFNQSFAKTYFDKLDHKWLPEQFAKNVRKITSVRDYMLTEDVNKILVRRVLLNTRVYLNFLRKRYAFGWEENEVRSQWGKVRKYSNSEVTESEISQLLNWDIPVFYQLGDKILCGLTREKVDSAYNPYKSINRRFKTYRKKSHEELLKAMAIHIEKFSERNRQTSQITELKQKKAGF